MVLDKTMENPMKTRILAALVIAASATLAFAEDGNVTTKAMKDLPGNTGAGTTANPTAKPDSGSLSEKQMQDQPGVNSDKSGKTANPTAKVEDGSLSAKEMKDAPGVNK
jgi:hypothetical protein